MKYFGPCCVLSKLSLQNHIKHISFLTPDQTSSNIHLHIYQINLCLYQGWVGVLDSPFFCYFFQSSSAGFGISNNMDNLRLQCPIEIEFSADYILSSRQRKAGSEQLKTGEGNAISLNHDTRSLSINEKKIPRVFLTLQSI